MYSRVDWTYLIYDIINGRVALWDCWVGRRGVGYSAGQWSSPGEKQGKQENASASASKEEEVGGGEKEEEANGSAGSFLFAVAGRPYKTGAEGRRWHRPHQPQARQQQQQEVANEGLKTP